MFWRLGDAAWKVELAAKFQNPELDSWAPITPMITMRIGHRVIALGSEEFFVHGGDIYNPDYNGPEDVELLDPEFSEVYNAVRDEWRRVNKLAKDGGLFMAHGKPHLIDSTGISIHDVDTNSSRDWHPFSLAKSQREVSRHCGSPVLPWTTQAVGNELVTILRQYYSFDRKARDAIFLGLGFESREEGIQWRKAECSFELGKSSLICPLQL